VQCPSSCEGSWCPGRATRAVDTKRLLLPLSILQSVLYKIFIQERRENGTTSSQSMLEAAIQGEVDEAKVAEDQPRLGYRSVSTFRMAVVIRFERSKDFLCTHYCAQILVIGTEEKELGSVITFSQHHQHLHHPIHPSLLRHLSSEPGWQDRTWHDRQSLPATCCSPTISDPEDEEFVFPRHNGRKTSSASDKDGCRRSTGPSQAMRLKHHHLCEANEVLWSVSSR
jgi:hypothetical protein